MSNGSKRKPQQVVSVGLTCRAQKETTKDKNHCKMGNCRRDRAAWTATAQGVNPLPPALLSSSRFQTGLVVSLTVRRQGCAGPMRMLLLSAFLAGRTNELSLLANLFNQRNFVTFRTLFHDTTNFQEKG
eukprot:1035935-Rhodomonas_salina.1